LLLLLAGPPLAYIALRWGEQWRELRLLLAANWFRLRKSELTRQLTQQRQTLAHQVREVVQRASSHLE
jgi:hypothetical protein